MRPTPAPPNTMDPADPQNSMLTPVVAGRCILLGSNSRLFILCELILRSLAQLLDAVNGTWHSSDLRRDLATPDQTDYDTGADDKGQNKAVLAVCEIWSALLCTKPSKTGEKTYTTEGSSL